METKIKVQESQGVHRSHQHAGTVWQLGYFMHTSAENFSLQEERKGEQGMWWRTVTQAAIFGVEEEAKTWVTHQTSQEGPASIQKINLRLADCQEEIRWRDAGDSVSRRDVSELERWERRLTRRTQDKWNQRLFWKGKGNEKGAQPFSLSPRKAT